MCESLYPPAKARGFTDYGDKILHLAHLKLFVEDKKILRLSKENLFPVLSKKYMQEDLEEKLSPSSSKLNNSFKI